MMSENTVVRAGRKEWVGLAVLALPTLLLSLDMSVLNLALPALSTDLGASAAEQLWIVDIYGFMIAGFLLTMGTLGDRVGRRRLLLIGAFVFGVVSAVAAFSATPLMLVLSRAALGIAGATLMPSTLSLLSTMFKDDKQRGLAIGVWMSCFMGGMAVGPVIGGVLLEYFWWGSLFLIGVPVMVLLVVVGPIVLPEFRNEDAGRLDLVSVFLSLATVLPIVFAGKALASEGPTPVNVLLLVAGFALAVVFVRRQRSLSEPLLDLRLFANRSLSAALGVAFLCTMTMGGVTLLISLYLQEVLAISPLQAGFALVPAFLLAIVGNMAAPALIRRFRPALVISAGLLITAVGLVVLASTDPVTGLATAIVGYTVAFAGTSPMGVLTTGIVVGSAPEERTGSAAALSETNGEFGIAMGVAVLGSMATAVYRGNLGDATSGLSPADAEVASDSVSGALDVAARAGEGLATVAREAFSSGVTVVCIIAAVAMVLYAGLVLALLRHVPADGTDSQPEPASDATGSTENGGGDADDGATTERSRSEPVGAAAD